MVTQATMDVDDTEDMEVTLSGDDDQSTDHEQTDDQDDDQKAQAPETDADKEARDYGNRAQKRINDLTSKWRKEERDREEAVRIAQALHDENQKLKGRIQNLDSGYLTEYGSRVETQLSAARDAMRMAYDSGDSEAIVAAQEALSRAASDEQRFKLAKQRADQVSQQPQPQEQQAQPQRQQPQQQPQQHVEPDPQAQGWAEKNKWFGSDEVMTYAAFGIHQKLVEAENFDPNSKEYYDEIDRRMRAEFPHKFQRPNGGGTPIASGASSASRRNQPGRKTVKLTASQVAMANRLGVPVEEYAKYVKD